MWAYEHSVETTVAAAAIWRLWADVASWGRWNKDIEAVVSAAGRAVASRR